MHDLKEAPDLSTPATPDSGHARVRTVGLSDVNAYVIPRDRTLVDRAGEDWQALKASLASRGQHAPIDVYDMGVDAWPRFGLVTGLRRWLALSELRRETEDARFDRIDVLVRPLPDPVAQLLTMVEENEIRQDISFFERGSLVTTAVEQGLFGTNDLAVDTLFASTSRNYRYKIRAFAELADGLGAYLSFPAAIGERLGLTLVKALRKGRGPALREGLRVHGATIESAADEIALLRRLVAPARRGPVAPPPMPATDAIWRGAGDTRIEARMDGEAVMLRIVGLSDPTPENLQVLVEWLGSRMAVPDEEEPSEVSDGFAVCEDPLPSENAFDAFRAEVV